MANESDHQQFPQTGPLAERMDLDLAALAELFPEQGSPAYSYVVATLEQRGGQFAQTGTGPNFQGGLITLCTCKHRMRTSLDIKPGVWIAGFSGTNVAQRGNALFYLMRVGWAFPSHADLWQWLPTTVQEVKAAHRHILGDVLQPLEGRIEPGDESRFVPDNYLPPKEGHSHAPTDWEQDINYPGPAGRRPVLLVGDPERSFLWSRPMIYYNSGRHPRTKRWSNLRAFLQCLDDG